MTTTCQQLVEPNRGSGAIHLLLTQGELKVLAGAPKRIEEELLFRATQMSQVLEEILRRPHHEIHWGLNE